MMVDPPSIAEDLVGLPPSIADALIELSEETLAYMSEKMVTPIEIQAIKKEFISGVVRDLQTQTPIIKPSPSPMTIVPSLRLPLSRAVTIMQNIRASQQALMMAWRDARTRDEQVLHDNGLSPTVIDPYDAVVQSIVTLEIPGCGGRLYHNPFEFPFHHNSRQMQEDLYFKIFYHRVLDLLLFYIKTWGKDEVTVSSSIFPKMKDFYVSLCKLQTIVDLQMKPIPKPQSVACFIQSQG